MNALSTSIFNQLAGGTALISLLGGTAIYKDQAPDKAPLPYVIFSYQGGGDQNINPWRLKNLLVFVRSYAATPVATGNIDTQIDARLHAQTLSITGWSNFWTMRESDLENVETSPNGEKIHMAGGIYRIRLCQ
jgi:hypothetical protein